MIFGWAETRLLIAFAGVVYGAKLKMHRGKLEADRQRRQFEQDRQRISDLWRGILTVKWS